MANRRDSPPPEHNLPLRPIPLARRPPPIVKPVPSARHRDRHSPVHLEAALALSEAAISLMLVPLSQTVSPRVSTLLRGGIVASGAIVVSATMLGLLREAQVTAVLLRVLPVVCRLPTPLAPQRIRHLALQHLRRVAATIIPSEVVVRAPLVLLLSILEQQ